MNALRPIVVSSSDSHSFGEVPAGLASETRIRIPINMCCCFGPSVMRTQVRFFPQMIAAFVLIANSSLITKLKASTFQERL